MKVYVATCEANSIASRALRMEGIGYMPLWTHIDEFSYGRGLADLWDRGDQFVLLEHDIAPWPGLVKQLWDCPEPWCTACVPFPNGTETSGLNINKFVPRGRAPEVWRETPWRMLDGEVLHRVRTRLGVNPHIHTPGVAHCRARVEE